MIKGILTRTYYPDATVGHLVVKDAGDQLVFECDTIERSRTDPSHPCIPEGVYRCGIYQSPTHGRVYEVENVPGRTYIEIHVANVPSDLLGCIGLGRGIGRLEKDGMDQRAVFNSAVTLLAFMDTMRGEPWMLEITAQTEPTANEFQTQTLPPAEPVQPS